MAALHIPIAKGGKKAIFTFDSDIFNELSEEKQLEIIGAGMEKFLNAGMSSSEKYPAPTKLEGAALEKAAEVALAKAQSNLDELKDPAKPLKAIKYNAAKAKAKPSTAEDRQILSEAKRQAIAVLKNRARAQGIKPLSAVPASKWTEMALVLIAQDPKFLADAKQAIVQRSTSVTDMDLKALIVLDPEKVAKAKAKSAKAKVDPGSVSAKQAGIVQPHQMGKGKVPPARPTAHQSH